GISYSGDLIDLALKADVVQKTGAWFSYNDEKIGQGRENAKKFIEDQNKVRKEIEKQVMGFLGQ
ncbi:MAG: DNA recombination/repair protein RecA, partial [bacterium TMED198]